MPRVLGDEALIFPAVRGFQGIMARAPCVLHVEASFPSRPIASKEMRVVARQNLLRIAHGSVSARKRVTHDMTMSTHEWTFLCLSQAKMLKLETLTMSDP